MNHIKNEQGLIVIAEGSEGSPIRMKCKYPIQMNAQIGHFVNQTVLGERVVIEFTGDFTDKNHFVKAVRFYGTQIVDSINKKP